MRRSAWKSDYDALPAPERKSREKASTDPKVYQTERFAGEQPEYMRWKARRINEFIAEKRDIWQQLSDGAPPRVPTPQAAPSSGGDTMSLDEANQVRLSLPPDRSQWTPEQFALAQRAARVILSQQQKGNHAQPGVAVP